MNYFFIASIIIFLIVLIVVVIPTQQHLITQFCVIHNNTGMYYTHDGLLINCSINNNKDDTYIVIFNVYNYSKYSK